MYPIMKNRNTIARRSWVLVSAALRTGAGTHTNTNKKRKGGRSERRRASVKDGW